ncbi:MAG: hypothetical protein MUE85_21650 [Microscillaceae bacterium]|jgi:hypothetical protein|nr:hypothetical protein [Microscillaceae bacterium]
MRYKPIIWLLCLSLAFATCKKKNVEPKLPPETQVGANTFGCRVNGQVWVPSGNDGTPNMLPYFSPSINTFAIGTYRIIGRNNIGSIYQNVGIALLGLTEIGIYPLAKDKARIGFDNQQNGCSYDNILPDNYYG